MQFEYDTFNGYSSARTTFANGPWRLRNTIVLLNKHIVYRSMYAAKKASVIVMFSPHLIWKLKNEY